MIVENSGLLTVAALKHLKLEGKKVVSILSGGNMDVITMSSVVQHGLILQRPYLHRVRSASGPAQASWQEWQLSLPSSRATLSSWIITSSSASNRNAAVELKITVEAFGTEHKEKIVKALKDKGYKPKLTHANL